MYLENLLLLQLQYKQNITNDFVQAKLYGPKRHGCHTFLNASHIQFGWGKRKPNMRKIGNKKMQIQNHKDISCLK